MNLLEAQISDPFHYTCFDDFFTRALAAHARPLPEHAQQCVLSPVDGKLSQYGLLTDGEIIQAKGLRYTLADLIGDASLAQRFEGGMYLTEYLAPMDYHRIHMPMDGRLKALRYIPGRLFSVKPACIAHIPRLFARNERAVAHFETAYGDMIMVLVAATLVSGIETVWGGPVPAGRGFYDTDCGGVELAQGDEMGRFHFGSTVICAFTPHPSWQWVPLEREQSMRLNQPLITGLESY